MWLIVGLGNPGPRYERNPHNIGFRVADELARRHTAGPQPFRDKLGGEIASTRINGDRAIILKPMQYMNVSGQAVQRAAHFHKVEPENIIVVHDEIDFPLGRVKVKSGGGHGGHNGLRSIVQQLGSADFARVRVGIGRPTRDDGTPIGAADGDRVANYLLSDFPASMEREVEDIAKLAADAVEDIVAHGVDKAMNERNTRLTSAD